MSVGEMDRLGAEGSVSLEGGEAPVPPSIFGAEEGVLEPQFQAALAAISRPSRLGSGLLLVGSLVLFLLIGRAQERSIASLVLLVFTLLFHELGHFLGMKAFGYRDVKMFFIPFFGAAVSGKPSGVAAWKQATVLLLGPVPGITLGGVLAIYWGTQATSLQHTLILDLIFINAFNLLPLAALDGGPLLQNVLFSRHRILEIGFLLLVLVATAAVAAALKAPMLGLLAYLVLVSIPRRWGILTKAADLRKDWAGVPFDWGALPGDQGRRLFLAAREVVRPGATAAPRVAATMEELVETANRKAPSALATVVLFLGWIASLLLACVAALMMLVPPVRWAPWRAADGSFSVLIPGPPSLDGGVPGGSNATGDAPLVVANASRFAYVSVAREPVGSAASGEGSVNSKLDGQPATSALVLEDKVTGKPEVVTRRVSAIHQGYRYLLSASGSLTSVGRLERFFDSFRFLDSADSAEKPSK